MAKHTARRTVNEMDASTPFLTRLEFIEALAALAAVFAEDMDRKVQGANQRIAHVLWCAADPDRSECLFNNICWRHMLSFVDDVSRSMLRSTRSGFPPDGYILQ